jgi:citrate synthase
MILMDEALGRVDAPPPVAATVRMVRFLARLFGHEADLDGAGATADFTDLVALAVGGARLHREKRRLVEALAVASVDHGVTPPSAQATILAASVRAPFAVALASGVGAITDVHGGAGEQAAEFLRAAVSAAERQGVSPAAAAAELLDRAARSGRRVAGLGHRIHTRDPRRDVILELAQDAGAAGPCVGLIKLLEELFARARGFRLPINVDGVIGAVVADLDLVPAAAKALFVLGRTAGLAAHYSEEVLTQAPMRRIRFEEAVYRGPPERPFSPPISTDPD